MAEEFDLKKFLAQHSNINHDVLWKALVDDAGLREMMSSYLDEIQASGHEIVSQYLTDKEANLLVAMCIGQAAHFTMVANPEDVIPVMQLITKHKDLLFTLVAVSMACGVGMAAKEEWR